jgi:hypothetical protein
VPDPPTSGTVSSEVVAVGRGCPASGATPADPYLTDPSGKIALVTRGSCTFDGKYQRAVAAGAVGVVIRNSSPGLFVGGGVTPVAGKFLVAISQADGLAIAALSQPNRASLTWTSTRVNAPNPTGGLLSSFSSYGPTAVLGLKPDLGAPGGFIRSTYPLELGGYTVLSGTSMSSPHVAGAAALLEQAHPSLPAASFRDVLMNSARPALWSLGPQYGIADYVFRQGAGMIDIPASIGAQTTITPSKVALGEGSGGPFTLHLQNGSSHPVTYDVAYEEGFGAGPPGMPFGWTFLLADTKASLPATVTVPGDGRPRSRDPSRPTRRSIRRRCTAAGSRSRPRRTGRSCASRSWVSRATTRRSSRCRPSPSAAGSSSRRSARRSRPARSTCCRRPRAGRGG